MTRVITLWEHADHGLSSYYAGRDQWQHPFAQPPFVKLAEPVYYRNPRRPT